MGLVSDLSMGFGFTEKTQDFVDRTAKSIERTQGKDAASSYASSKTDDGFANNFDKTSVSTKINSGDTVSQLALDNNTTIEQIKKDNPGIDINNIKAGATINITSNTRNEGESIYTGATQDELDAGNKMIASGGNNSTGSATSSLTSEQQKSLSGGNLFSNYDIGPSTSTSGLTKVEVPNGASYYADESGTFIGFVPENEVAVEKTDYQKKLEAAGESDLSGLDQIAATNVDYTGVKNTNPVASTNTYNDTVVVADPVSQTPFDDSTTSSGKDYTEAATSDTDESLTAYTDVVTNAPETTDVVTNAPETETYNGETVQVKYLSDGEYADNPLKYYVNSNGNYVGLAPRDYTTTATTTTSGGRNLDGDLGVGGSEATVTASELLNDDIDTDNTTKYGTTDGGGVILSDDNAKAIDQIISGGSTASSIVGGGTTTPASSSPATTDPIGGYSSLTQEDFIKEADAVIVPFSDMTPEQAEVLGLSDTYKPGDMVLPQDLELLKDAGYTVTEASYDEYDTAEDPAEDPVQADIDMAGIGETSSYTPTIASSTGSRPGYDYASTPGQVAYTGTGGSEIDKYDPRNIMPTSEQLAIASGAADEIVDKTPNFLAAVTNTDLSLSEIARGLGFDTVGGFFNEAALRAEGTGDMADDALNALAKLSVIPEAQTYINPEYAENLRNLDEMNALDRLALEKEALDKGVSVASLLDPSISAETGATIPISLSEGTKFVSVADKLGIEGDITVASNALEGIVENLSERSKDQFRRQAEETPGYYKAIQDGMPNPDNEGYNMAGEKITPGLWMASVAAQELLGLGLDVGAVLLLGPVAGGALVAQQGVAEAGRAAGNEVIQEMEELRAQGAFDNMSEEDYNEMVSGAEKQAFYTSGIAGGAVDTITALTAGGFAPLAKALPNAIRSGLIAAGVVTAEGISGGLEQAGVNAAVIKALKDQGIDPADYDKGYLDKVLTAAVYEVVGGSTSGAASGVGSYVSNLSSKSDTDSEDPLDAFGGPGESLLTEMNKEGSNISVVGNNEKNATGGYDEYTLIDNNTGKTETVSAKDFNTAPSDTGSYDEFGALAGGVDSTGAGESLLNEMNKEGSDISVVGNNEKNATGGYDKYTLIDNNTGKTETVTAKDFNTAQAGESGALAGGVGGTDSKKKQLVLGGTSVETVTNRQGEAVEVVTITDGNGNTTVTVGDTSQIVSGGENSVVTDPKTGVSVNVNASNTADITSTAGLVTEIAAETNTDPTILLSGSTVNVSVADPFTEVVADPLTEVVADPLTEVVSDPVTEVLTKSVIDAKEPATPPTSYTPDPVTPPTSYTPDSGPAPVGETATGYTSGIAGIGGVRPTVAPRYQSRSVGQYTPYRPESGVIKTPTGPASATPSTYLAETVQGGMRYGNPYILPNADPELLAQLARLQGTGDARFPAEYLLNDEDLE